MTGMFRKFFNQETPKFTDAEFKHYYIEFCNQRIAELEREYMELIQKPYQAGRLSEIISELGSIWNERLRYEDVDSAVNGNGAKNLGQVQHEVSHIVQEAKQQLAISRESDDKLAVFEESLLKLRQVLDEWEPGLQ